MCVLIVIFLLAGCETRTSLAPVVELPWQSHNSRQITHLVRRGETLYAIAFRYDLDYRQLAALNHLQSPFSLHVGQKLRVKPGANANHPRRFDYKSKTVHKYTPQRPRPKTYLTQKNSQPVQIGSKQWLWPLNGRVTTGFIPQQGKKGIDIAGKKGEMVHATSSGVVAYAGSGLAGYGNLIIIKHNDGLLTAYGNNSRNIVKEGQKVKAGQNIAEIGVMDRRYWGVHFEIRKNGKPVNPLDYLRKN
ncbi:MAG: peptidoglycan DD-metalloendopeptidase family protein [Tatlockia sp.]|nr:peptidoglycan DD-metalloendopeptidase family protein [Tatlockia sp.]